MRQSSVILVLLLLAAGAGTVSAKDCGGGIVCECGDTVVGDWTLTKDMIYPADAVIALQMDARGE